jgi:hypothetical protein
LRKKSKCTLVPRSGNFHGATGKECLRVSK